MLKYGKIESRLIFKLYLYVYLSALNFVINLLQLHREKRMSKVVIVANLNVRRITLIFCTLQIA